MFDRTDSHGNRLLENLSLLLIRPSSQDDEKSSVATEEVTAVIEGALTGLTYSSQ